MKELEFHSVASIFPMMSANEFAALKHSIRKNGQRESIYTHENKIVDGRDRYKACLELGLSPRFQEWDGKGLLVDFVCDLNAERRQLKDGALHIAAARYAAEREKEAKQLSGLRKGDSPLESIDSDGDLGRSRVKAAEKFGIGESTVRRAMRVVKRGAPELIEAVNSDQTSTWAAYHIATLPVEKQKEIVAQGGEAAMRIAQDIQRSNRTQRNTSVTNGAEKPAPQKPEEKEDDGEIKLQGMGVFIAHEAINCLKRIRKDDGLRKRGFQVVTDWIKRNQ